MRMQVNQLYKLFSVINDIIEVKTKEKEISNQFLGADSKRDFQLRVKFIRF
jgi:hypothetical protein